MPESKMLKHTDEEINNRLFLKQIRKCGEFIGMKKNYKFECIDKTCNFMWDAMLISVLRNKNGCPKCVKTALSNKIKTDLLNRNIILLEDFVKIGLKYLVKNTICKHEWRANINDLYYSESNCPQCNKIDKNEIILKLAQLNIELIGDFKTTNDNANFRHLICGKEWSARISNIYKEINKCTRCYGKERLTKDKVCEELLKRDILLLDDFKTSRSKVRFRHLICGNEWPTTVSSVYTTGSGCPNCSAGKNEQLMYNMLLNNNIDFIYQQNIKKLNNLALFDLEIDFYLSNKKIAYEYNGAQHYGPIRFNNISQEKAETNFEKQKIRDAYLELFCKENDIILIWIDGRKYHDKTLKAYIRNEILNNE